jgi:hypothetical protein
MIPESWTRPEIREPSVSPDIKAAAARAAQDFWDDCKKNPRRLRALFTGMREDEIHALAENLAVAGAPSFSMPVVRADICESGVWHIDAPVNGGALSLSVREKDGVMIVSDLTLNMN